MAIKYYDKYPQRWESPSNDYPQGAFKNLSALGEQDGSYLEKDWLNDQAGFFGALLRNAEMTPNGLVDTAQRSQFYDALLVCARKAVDLSGYYTKTQVDAEIQANKIEVVDGLGQSTEKVINQKVISELLDNIDNTYIEFYGVNALTTPEFNAQVFVNTVKEYGKVRSRNGYTFNFTEPLIKLSQREFVLDLKGENVFLNFKGIEGENIKNAYVNASIDAQNTPFKNFIKCINVENLIVESIKISNVRVNQFEGDEQFFAIEYSSGESLDVDKNIYCKNIEAYNCVTTSNELNSGSDTLPMTILGSYGSRRDGRIAKHNIKVDNIIVKEFYSIGIEGENIGGDSDVFRIFSNPSNLTISNLYAKNVGKRVIKTQHEVFTVIDNLYIEQDAQFDQSTSFVSVIDNQGAGKPDAYTHTTIKNGRIISDNPCRLLTGSNSVHSYTVENIYANNLNIYIYPDVDSRISINNSHINKLSMQAKGSVVYTRNCTLMSVETMSARANFIEDCTITLDENTIKTVYPIGNLTATNVIFNLNKDNRIGDNPNLSNVTLNYTNNDVPATRPFRASFSGVYFIDGVRVNGLNAALNFIDSSNVVGTLVISNFLGGLMTPAYLNAGTWDVFFNNVNSTTIGGGAIKNIKVVNYV